MPLSTLQQATFLDTAFELLSHAVDAEDNHDYTEAYARYMTALDYLMAAQQSETNEKSRILLKTKTDEYLGRAEAIKQRADAGVSKQLDAPHIAVDQLSFRTPQSVILDEAFKCVKQAIDADTLQNYAEAYRQYMKSMDYFMFAQRYEPDEQARSLIRSEVGEYLSRAETIKKHLDSFAVQRVTDDVSLDRRLPRPPEEIFLHTAIEFTQRAIQQDAKENYPSAYTLYNGALDYFMLAHKYEKNEESKVAIRANIEEYLSRAELLKKRI